MSDVIMYFTYVSPEGSTIYNNTEYSDYSNAITKIYDDLEKIRFDYPDTSLFLSGDFNSRTKDYLDFMPCDNLIHLR